MEWAESALIFCTVAIGALGVFAAWLCVVMMPAIIAALAVWGAVTIAEIVWAR